MIIAVVLIAFAVLVAFWVIIGYNGLVRGRNMIREAWSGIDVQLKRRHDLIPNLVETVKAYSSHEQKLFADITENRAKSMQTQAVAAKGEYENAISGQLRSIIAVAEAYPDLKAQSNFLDLQKSLTEIEDQIQYARRYYNAVVRDYNIKVESFPSLIYARSFGFKRAEFFEIALATEREAVSTTFG
ncbi:MAG: LemA family protein [Armatimonadota bacterium]|jgi:LemA protein